MPNKPIPDYESIKNHIVFQATDSRENYALTCRKFKDSRVFAHVSLRERERERERERLVVLCQTPAAYQGVVI